MPGIEAAYRGRMNMLQAIFGSSKSAVPKVDNGPSLFKDLKRLALKQKRKNGKEAKHG